MQSKILAYVVTILLQMLTPDMIKQLADIILDFVENTVEKSASKADDQILIPLCALIRTALSIPDNDVNVISSTETP